MFLTDLVVREVGEDEWELREDLVYQGRDERFVVPAGTRTDFASIPSQLRWFIPKYGRYNRAAVLHDWLSARSPGFISRSDADGVFRRSMRELGVGFLRRWMMWAAVRLASRLQGATPVSATLALVIAVVAGPFAAAGLVIAQVLMWAYQVLEILVYGARALARRVSGRPPLDEPFPAMRMYWTRPTPDRDGEDRSS